MNWEVYPDGLRELLVRLHRDYHPVEMYVTENGCAMPDVFSSDGQVHDPRRIAYLQSHFQAMHQAIDEGAPIKGYFAWTMMDNFEWAYGYTMRFGLIYVDYATQQRIPKDSFRFYQDVIRDNAVPEGTR
jgi:beta-glucosidase